jgi:hypothetical protein
MPDKAFIHVSDKTADPADVVDVIYVNIVT